MSIKNKINGVFRDSHVYSKINGVWRNNTNGFNKVNGVWRSSYEEYFHYILIQVYHDEF